MTTERSDHPLVVIWSLVYNHKPYLRDFFQGILMQQTNFRFILIVHDDKSTDGSTDIICEYAEKYPDIIKPILESENQYSKKDGSIDRIMYEAISSSGAKYIAFCEGDDYWSDPLKLQMQVDFLQSHIDYGMCYSKVAKLLQNKNEIHGEFGGNAETYEQLIKGNNVPTLTTMIRTDIYYEYYDLINPYVQHWLMMDYPLWLYIANKTHVKYLNVVTGIYRVINNSASHPVNYLSQLTFAKSYCLIRNFYNNRFNIINTKLSNEIELDVLKAELKIALYKNIKKKEAVSQLRKYYYTKSLNIIKRIKLIPWIIYPSLTAKIDYYIWCNKMKNQ